MTLTPRGASDVPDDATEPHPEYGPCDGFGPHGECAECWKARFATEDEWLGWLRAAEDIEIDPAVVGELARARKAIRALTTRSAALEAEKAELIKALREWDTVEQFDRLLDSLPPEDEPEPPNIKIDDLCNSDISRSMPEQSTGSVASSPSPAERTE